MAHTATASIQNSVELSLFVNAMPGTLAFLDTNFLIRQVNKGFQDYTGRRADGLLGQPVWAVFSPTAAGQVDAWQQALQAVCATRQAQTLSASGARLTPTTANEQVRYLDWALRPVPAGDGQLAGIILQASEVPCPQEEQPDHRNQELLQAIHQNLNDVVWDCDLSTNHIWWSNGFKTAFGYPPQEADRIADCWYSRIHPEDATRVIAGIQQVIDSDLTLWSDVYRFKKKNGEYADLLTRGSVLRDAQGKGYRMIGTMVDITLHKKAERKRAAEHLSLAY